jgi:hypothetical protein
MTNLTTQTESTEAYQATQHLLRRIVPPEFYYRLRTFNRRYPWMFLPLARWRWQRWRKQYGINPDTVEPAAPYPLERDTEIVIEAYPRCGNTFAHVAFKFAQTKPVNIAHHTHAAAQVIAGAKQKIPTLVIIRPPEDAICSYLVGGFDPGLTVKQALREYISFYSLIIPFSSAFVVATFEELTQDFGAIIKRINQTYQTSFDEFEHTEANVKKCFDLIDRGYETIFGQLSNKTVSRPATERAKVKNQLQEQFNLPSNAKLKAKAEQIYQQIYQKHTSNNYV